MGNFYKEFKHVADPELLEERFQSLLNSPLGTVQEMELWLMKQSLLFEEIMETTLGHRIDFNLETTNHNKRQRMLDDQTQITPIVESHTNLLDKRFIDHPLCEQLNNDVYGEYIRRKKNAIDLFHEENIDRDAEIERLSTEYIRTVSAITVPWESRSKSESQMQGLLESEDRNIRKQAWLAIQNAHLNAKDDIEEIFQSQFKLRNKVAIQAGFENYREYSFQKLERFDYNADDCMTLAENIRKHVLPVKRLLDERNKSALGVDTFAPWDVIAPLQNHTPKYPFTSSQQLIEKGMNVFKQIDPFLFEMVQNMHGNHYFDLEPKDGKSPGAFCLPMLRSGHSFLVMNINGNYNNIRLCP
jgi:oligoendopeptidase F